ncbi:MAG: HdeD family acid-resistance protein [Solirubrobacteraceae bacterium]
MREDVLTPEQVRALARSWWIAVALGVLSIVAGGIVLARPDHSLRALAVIIGIFILIDGVVELYWAIGHRAESTATAALLGILNVVVGVLLIRHPIAGVQAIALFIGIWLIAVGVVRAVVAVDAPGGRLGRLLIAGVEILAGIVIVSSPDIGYATLTLLVGFSFIANGIAMIAAGLLLRMLRAAGRRGRTSRSRTDRLTARAAPESRRTSRRPGDPRGCRAAGGDPACGPPPSG